MGDSERIKIYSSIKYACYFAGMILTFLFLAAYQFLLSSGTKEIAVSFSSNLYTGVTLYALLFLFAQYCLFLPLNFYRGYTLEHKFGLSNESLKGWLKDEVKKNAISLLIFLPILNLFFFVLKNTGNMWWIWMTAAYLVFSLLFTRIMPMFIIPLFYKCGKIDNNSLISRIKETANRAKVKFVDVFKIDLSRKTKKANAAVVGLGPSRRILLSDTLLEDFNEDEVIVVLAHEFGHHRLFHMPKLILFSVIVTSVSLFVLNLFLFKVKNFLGAENLYDLLLFPAMLFILNLFSVIIAPLSNAYSRYLERQADKYSVELTNNPGAFISVMNRLAEKNMADPDPPRIVKYMFYDHPPISERIKTVNRAG